MALVDADDNGIVETPSAALLRTQTSCPKQHSLVRCLIERPVKSWPRYTSQARSSSLQNCDNLLLAEAVEQESPTAAASASP